MTSRPGLPDRCIDEFPRVAALTKPEFLNLFAEIVEEEPTSLTGSEKLKEQIAGWNSLAVVSFIAMVDEQFDLTLSPKAIAGCKTVNDLITLLDGMVAD